LEKKKSEDDEDEDDVNDVVKEDAVDSKKDGVVKDGEVA